MTERPILFSAPMVRAILAGTKTQTRRVVKPQPSAAARAAGVITSSTNPDADGTWWWLDSPDLMEAGVVGDEFRCPYGKPGDRLWVRETWAIRMFDDAWFLHYEADGYRAQRPECGQMKIGRGAAGRLRPSIHMPRWASRILLEVTDVRVQRLQDISGQDARAEGVERIHCYGPDCPDGENGCNARGCYGARERFQELWDSINGAGAWNENPWVWAVSFQRVTP